MTSEGCSELLPANVDLSRDFHKFQHEKDFPRETQCVSREVRLTVSRGASH